MAGISGYGSDVNFKAWGPEWHGWIEKLQGAARGDSEQERQDNLHTRLTAARRMVKLLRRQNYAIPLNLFEGTGENAVQGLRRSAASSLLMHHETERIQALVSAYFAELPFEQMLARLYCQLRFAAPLRSGEADVLTLDALSELDPVSYTHLTLPTNREV